MRTSKYIIGVLTLLTAAAAMADGLELGFSGGAGKQDQQIIGYFGLMGSETVAARTTAGFRAELCASDNGRRAYGGAGWLDLRYEVLPHLHLVSGGGILHLDRTYLMPLAGVALDLGKASILASVQGTWKPSKTYREPEYAVRFELPLTVFVDGFKNAGKPDRKTSDRIRF